VSPVYDADGRAVGRQGRRRRVARAVSSLPIATAGAQGFGYDVFERSPTSGEPVEGLRFVQAATTWRFTSADSDLALSTGTYIRDAIVHEALDYSQEDTAGNTTVQVPRSNPVAQLFVNYVPTSPVYLTIFRKHRADPQEIVIFVGKVVSCTFDGPQALLLCAPVSQTLNRKVPSVLFGFNCAWNLYGVGCGVARATFKTSGTILALSGTTVRATAFAAKPDGWFTNGWAETADGQRRFIVAHVGDALTLMNPFPSSLAVGAAIDAQAGCERTELACGPAKFDNLPQHLGFPRIPTRNPYEGSIV